MAVRRRHASGSFSSSRLQMCSISVLLQPITAPLQQVPGHGLGSLAIAPVQVLSSHCRCVATWEQHVNTPCLAHVSSNVPCARRICFSPRGQPWQWVQHSKRRDSRPQPVFSVKSLNMRECQQHAASGGLVGPSLQPSFPDDADAMLGPATVGLAAADAGTKPGLAAGAARLDTGA